MAEEIARARQRAAMVPPVADLVKRHETLLWWLHSLYALCLGVGVMWLGAKNFSCVQVVALPIAFIWVSSLFLPTVAETTRLAPQWRRRVCMAINYFNKNFYQQLLFFVLPVYYASATMGSRNTLFMAVLLCSAVLATLDVVYDRYLSTKWPLTALFFAFNLFACINVILSVLWAMNSHTALRISAGLAFIGFASMVFRLSQLRRRHSWSLLVMAAVLLLATVERGRGFIPPVPLRLVKAEFGREVAVESLEIRSPVTELPAAQGEIFALTAIKAPLGLRDKVIHKWRLNGKLVNVSRSYELTGGRENGYRIWSYLLLKDEAREKKLLLDVETEGGQLIGRAKLRTRPEPSLNIPAPGN